MANNNMNSRVDVVVGLLFLAFVVVVSPLQLRIEPGHLHVRSSTLSNITVTCMADEALTDCQFKVYEHRYKRELPTFDLSKEYVTSKDVAALLPGMFGRISGYNYTGTGLESGQCGITMNLTNSGGDKHWVVGCRVRSVRGGGWHHAEMNVYGSDQKPFNFTRSARTMIVLPGETATVLFKAEEPLTYCHFQLPVTALDVAYDKGQDSPATSLYHYHGESLIAGDCGVIIHRATDARNGWLQVVYRTKTDTLEWMTTTVLVAQPPAALVLEIQSNNMTENATLVATCTVKDSRPDPRISWFIGDKLVRQDDLNDCPEEKWLWTHNNKTFTQVLTRKLSREDEDKELRCLVEHIALNYAMLLRKTIRFYCDPAVSKCCDHQETYH